MTNSGPLPEARDPDKPRVVELRNAGRVQRAQRRNRVLALAAAGATNVRIAELLGLSEQGVSSIILRSLEKYAESDLQKVENVRAMQLQRLDRMLTSIWPKVEEGNLKAIDRALRIEVQRAKIAGTERPTQHEHEHHHTVDPIEVDAGEVARLERAWKGTAVDATAIEISAELEPGDAA